MMDIHQHEKTTKGKLILVSNRLPVHVDIKSDNTIQFRSSAGGLATALNGFHKDHSGSLWVGWPGVIPLEHREEVKNRLLTEYGCYPVFLEADLVEKFYDGFSNNTLWPLFHSFPAYTRYLDSEWEAYKEANEQFGKAILEVASSGDCVWIHDFHIMLLPKILREALPDLVIGFFLHIPFPSYDIYRLMPWGSEITDAVLRADLVGFHTYDYVQNFLAVVRRSLGIDNNLGVIVRDQLVCHVDVFPIGIDFNKFNESTDDPAVQLEIAKIEKRHHGQKVIFAVSRLDYTKGIIESLHAFETLLVTQPQYQKKAVFVLVVVPSRERVKRYASLKKEIDESVGRINSKYGSFEWHPVLYLFQSLTFAELTAYYFCADVGLVIPSRDGMNLVAKEYLATKKDSAGVLVLSEMAGSAKELQEALLVNPNSKRDVVEALDHALTMPLDEQIRRNEPMRSRLEEYDTTRWGTMFLNRLDKARDARKELVFRVLDSAIRDELIENWRNARKKLIILDYDGCLVPFNRNLQAALPDRALIDLLERLGSKKDAEVVLLTSRDRGFLERHMGHAQNVTLVAQAGGWSRPAGSSEWQSAITNSSHIAWREHILPLMQMTRDRIPGSDLTDDELTITWDWRRADPDTALTAAKELLDVLIHLTASMPLKVSMTPKSIVIRDGQIGKGTYYNNQLAGDEWDFLLAMGEDFEEVFASLPASAHSIQVGMKLSKAKCNFKSVYEARQLLASLADIKAYSG